MQRREGKRDDPEGKHRRQRDVPPDSEKKEPDRAARENGVSGNGGREEKEHSVRRRNALPAPESKPDREIMPENACDAHPRKEPGDVRAGSRERPRKEYGESALEHVRDAHDHGPETPDASADVRRSDIARSDRPYVDSLQQPHKKKSGRERSEQISEKNPKRVFHGRATPFSPSVTVPHSRKRAGTERSVNNQKGRATAPPFVCVLSINKEREIFFIALLFCQSPF